MRELARETVRSFTRHGGTLLAGACAFFAMLSAAPLFFIAIAIAGALTGEARARTELLRGMTMWLGPDGGAVLGRWLEDMQSRPAGPLASALSVVVLLYASTRLFTQVQRALNHMWDVQARPARDLKGQLYRQLRRR